MAPNPQLEPRPKATTRNRDLAYRPSQDVSGPLIVILAINSNSPQLGNDMNNEGDEPAGDLLWQQAREKYEDPASNLETLAESLGISRAKLIVEALRRGWKMRGAKKNSGTRATIQRFKELLQKRLGELEGHIDELVKDASTATSEREIRATNLLVRTLEKVLELERKDRIHRARKLKQRRKFDDAARDELARRIRGLRGAEGGGPTEPEPADRAGREPAAGLAELGTAPSADSA